MNLFKQIKILDTKNYTNDAILREKIEILSTSIQQTLDCR